MLKLWPIHKDITSFYILNVVFNINKFIHEVFYFYFMYKGVLPACVSVPGTHRGKKRISYFLELELWMVVSNRVGAEN